ncbi:hypothetical protein TCAL_10352 [Tigriopus californicus]|uniref:Piwi domain-containing protein n=1 Tax=Tigriopus californicus TaxID=6832 RepID=A0A553NCI6_TIGCA|nr:piwi-like protein Ago3 [Tigriopus californicus]TRY63151.1 hypothetical protein TCAL_10352 [Tigriopus californicus]|eukprot:TCALIF_10352-PA protein Name:"Similar to AGO3 Protein argonaute-3 (Drosophila melanogaster)" AED:0.06 eAED:0.06 QI:192/1/1/1/1/1/9/178/910
MAGRGRGAAMLAKIRSLKQAQTEEEPPQSESPVSTTSNPLPEVTQSRPASGLSSSTPTTATTHSAPSTPTVGAPESGYVSDKAPGSDGSASLSVGRGRSALLAKLAAQKSSRSPTIPEVPDVVSPTVELHKVAQKPIESMSKQLEAMEVTQKPVIRRGTQGKSVPCGANYVSLRFPPGKGVFEYHVAFTPQLDSMYERRRALDALGRIKTFDGVKLFLPTELPDEVTVLKVTTQSGLEVKVTVSFKAKMNLGHKDCIFLYNVLMRRVMEQLKMCQINRNFYIPSLAKPFTQYDLEVWPGFETAIDEYEGGLKLQIDISHRVLRMETAYKVIKGIAQKGGNVKNDVEKALLGTTVLTRYNNKTYRIDDIDWNTNAQSTFTNSKGEEVSFLDYYKLQYGIEIKDKEQPLLVNIPKVKAHGEAKVTKMISLIPELCNLTGLTEGMRSNFNLMREMATHTRVDPSVRQKTLSDFVQKIRTTPEAQAILDNWGLEISPHTTKVEGRLLDPERLHFGRTKEMVGPTADWTRSATSTPVLTAVNVDQWDLVFPKTAAALVKKFAETMQIQGKRMGISVAMPRPQPLVNDRTETYLTAIRNAIDIGTNLVVCIFPQQRADRYAAVKKLCYIERPVASQVVLQKTISNEKRLASVVQKVALQINCKLGGELWACDTPFKNAMVVGIDVYHDPGQRNQSIAGVVTSINQRFSRWHSTTSFQRPHQELVDALKISFLSGLKAYHQENNQWPNQVIVFRDGVGDGQMEFTQKHEVRQLKECFAQCERGYNPDFVFVVVQKRINTRIFGVARTGKFENPAPGTVVDHTITRRNFYDFFLVSQKVGQGTVSPTHYVVIEEEKNDTMPPDVVQKLAYKLTHMYYNWPGTVRVPAACQYAHKLAAMAGEHLKKEPNPALADKLFYL